MPPSKNAVLVAIGTIALVLLVSVHFRGQFADSTGAARHFALLADADAPSAVGSARARAWAAGLNARPKWSGDISTLAVTHLRNGDEAAVATNGSEVCVADLSKDSSTCKKLSQAVASQIFVAIPGKCGREYVKGYYVFGVIPDGVNNLSIDIGAEGIVNKYLRVVDNLYGVNLPSVDTVLSNFSESLRVKLPLTHYATHRDAC